MPVRYTSDQIREKYARAARWFDLAEKPQEFLGMARLRRDLLRRARGEVLEVAVGTGSNLRHYPPGCSITAVDLSPEMLEVARRKAERLGLLISLVEANAEALPFENESFDTVASSLSLCTFPDPVRALHEMARVCRADGRILLLEHGRSDREWLGRFQDRREDAHAKKLGCHWNREPRQLVEEAGLRVSSARRSFFGIFHRIEAAPEKMSSREGHHVARR